MAPVNKLFSESDFQIQMVAVPLSRSTPAELRDTMARIGLAISLHKEWVKMLLSWIVCRPLNPTIVPDDLRCVWRRFEEWVAGERATMQDFPSFPAIAEHHQALHAGAQVILDRSLAGAPVDRGVFESFMDQSHQLEWCLWNLHQEVGDLLGIIDPLTGVSSRKNMISGLQLEQERARRTPGGRCAISMMDFDHFKKINDTYGHQAGDQVLRAALGFVAGCLRNYDLIYRYGGEEFLICLPATGVKHAKKILKRVKDGLEAMSITLEGGARVRITASFGITLLDDSASVEEAIARCDGALYHAKQSGRNRIAVWRPLLVPGARKT